MACDRPQVASSSRLPHRLQRRAANGRISNLDTYSTVHAQPYQLADLRFQLAAMARCEDAHRQGRVGLALALVGIGVECPWPGRPALHAAALVGSHSLHSLTSRFVFPVFLSRSVHYSRFPPLRERSYGEHEHTHHHNSSPHAAGPARIDRKIRPSPHRAR